MTRPRTRGVTIRVFLADGTPQGLRIVERLGWTGLCLAFARPDYPEVRLRDELSRTGVYILIGPAAEGRHSTMAYVGEADAVRSRLDQHQREKDFWTDAYVLTTTDNSLNKAQGRYLESELLRLARDADLATLDNGTAPPTSWLSEPDIAVMDSYIDYALSLLPLLGVTLFESVDDTAMSTSQDPELPTPPAVGAAHVDTRPGARLFLRTVLTDAEGVDDARGFIVFEGATARRQENVMMPGYRELRHRLIAEGVLAPEDDDHYRLVKTFVFESPSAAASVLSGGSKNGRTEWKDAAGTTLKELQTSSVAIDATSTPSDAVSVAGTPTGVDVQAIVAE